MRVSLLLFLLLLPSVAALGISPPSLSLEGEAGETLTATLLLLNEEPTLITLKVETAGLPWVSVEKIVTLGPQQSAHLPLTVTVPLNASLGLHQSQIYLKLERSSSGVLFQPVFAIPLAITLTRGSLPVSSFQPPPLPSFSVLRPRFLWPSWEKVLFGILSLLVVLLGGGLLYKSVRRR